MQPDKKTILYRDLLLKWQKTINLVSPATLQNVWERHFEDSLQLLDFIPQNVKKICDIGSGAGFPGLLIAMQRPDIHVDLIEADTRKCAFLQTVSRETQCHNITVYNDRIENVMDAIEADCLTSRALASLRQIIHYAEPLWNKNPDLIMVLPKGANFQSEIDEAIKKFKFDYSLYPSKTDSKARILIVNNIRPL
tara:strand:- start:758 stop:1339 length:582 start_codon:yes stop_codon:yes gene_type:complete